MAAGTGRGVRSEFGAGGTVHGPLLDPPTDRVTVHPNREFHRLTGVRNTSGGDPSHCALLDDETNEHGPRASTVLRRCRV